MGNQPPSATWMHFQATIHFLCRRYNTVGFRSLPSAICRARAVRGTPRSTRGGVSSFTSIAPPAIGPSSKTMMHWREKKRAYSGTVQPSVNKSGALPRHNHMRGVPSVPGRSKAKRRRAVLGDSASPHHITREAVNRDTILTTPQKLEHV